MSFSGNNFNGCCSRNQSPSFLGHLSEFIGETVTIFTTSGGASGCGFTGCVISVNPCFVRLVTEFGVAPTNPLAENICGDMENGNGGGRNCMGPAFNCFDKGHHGPTRNVGSVCDIPVDRIAAFCHNAV